MNSGDSFSQDDGQLSADDQLAIGRLLALYGHLVDAKDWAGLRGLFATDAIFDLSAYGLPALIGIDQIMEFFLSAEHPQAHHSSNVVIGPDGSAVSARSKWLVGNADGSTAGGDYDDIVKKAAGEWRFAQRRVTRRWPDKPTAIEGNATE
jgi:SnoaL-like domain